MVKFSVIIPHYRDFEGLKRLIPSIPEKDNIQIIIVDDCSYDSKEIVEKEICAYERSNIQLYFNNPENRGAGVCRNIGMEHANGKWLIFSDADDYFTEGAFEVFERLYDSDADIIFFPMVAINIPSGTPSARHIVHKFRTDNYYRKPNHKNEIGLRYDYNVPWSKMVKKALVDDNNIKYEPVRYYNDVMFSAISGYYAKKISVENSIVYCVTRQEGRLASTKNAEAFLIRFNVEVRKRLFLRDKLSKSDLEYVCLWPGTQIVRVVYKRYGKEILKPILDTYKKNKIGFLPVSFGRMIDTVKKRSMMFIIKHID